MIRPPLALALACCVAGAGCASPSVARRHGGPTVYVHNTGQQPLRIYVIYTNAARFLGTVQPGEGDCFVLPWPTATYNLGAKSLEGEVASPAFQPASAVGWVWDLGMLLRTDAISLGPADAPCR